MTCASNAAPGVEPASASSPLVLERGRIIGKKYVLDRPAGFGGMAKLWVARNQATDAEVCVKLLVPDDADDPGAKSRSASDRETVARFRREAHAAAKLNHRAIIRVFDLLELDEYGAPAKGSRGANPEQAPYAYGIVMELLKGETLGDLLAKRGKIPLEEALDLFLPIVSALAHAHRASVVHRDIKPDNVFLALEPDGQIIPKVLDFGVSKVGSAEVLTLDGVLLGTPSFMSPEQARGETKVDARSDVFSAGILFYLMLSGENPFESGSFSSVLEAITRREVPILAEVPEEIWGVLQRSLEKDPSRRFNDATEFGVALRRASGRRVSTESTPGLPVAPVASPSPTSTVDPDPQDAAVDADAASAVRRRRQAIVAGVIGVAAAVCVAAIFVAAVGPASKPVAAPAASATTVATTALATGAPAPTPTVALPPSAEAAPTPTVAAPARAPVVSAAVGPTPTPTRVAPVTPGGSPAGPTTGTVRRPAPTASRRPGEEPHNARDPGF